MQANNDNKPERTGKHGTVGDLTPQEAAAELRMSIHTLRKHVAAGNIQYVQ